MHSKLVQVLRRLTRVGVLEPVALIELIGPFARIALVEPVELIELAGLSEPSEPIEQIARPHPERAGHPMGRVLAQLVVRPHPTRRLTTTWVLAQPMVRPHPHAAVDHPMSVLHGRAPCGG